MLNANLNAMKQPEDLVHGIHLPAANTAAIITIPAVANRKAVIHAIQWSYSAAPTAGRLTIVAGGVTVLDLDITAAGPGGYHITIVGDGIVITLAAGGAAIVGKLATQYVSES